MKDKKELTHNLDYVVRKKQFPFSQGIHANLASLFRTNYCPEP